MRSTEREDFGQIGGDQQDGDALGGEVAQERVHVRLGGDVDAPVGSSTISSDGASASQRASTTFC